jgi:hypothetical protein
MTTIVLKNRFNHNENGEEIDVDILDRDFDDDLEIIETNKGKFIRHWADYSSNDPYGWSEAHD